MSEDIETFCALNLAIRRCSGSSTRFDGASGLSRNLKLNCVVIEPPRHTDTEVMATSHFSGKRVAVHLVSPRDARTVDEMNYTIPWSQQKGACGIVWIRAGVAIEGSSRIESEPIVISVHLDPAAFQAIADHAVRIVLSDGPLQGIARFTGDALPRVPAVDRMYGLRLGELDVSADREYVLKDFCLYDAGLSGPGHASLSQARS